MSKTYWDNRYANGRSSGNGSKGARGAERLKYILSHFDPQEDTIVDYGCGDLTLWGGGVGHTKNAKLPIYYVGVDYSTKILAQNEAAFPLHTWLTPEAYLRYFKAHNRPELVICLDVMFHQSTYQEAIDLVANLCACGAPKIIISNWVASPFKHGTDDGEYQYFRPMRDFAHIFNRAGYTNKERILEADSLNALYLFESDKGVS